LIVVFSKNIQAIFHKETSEMFVIFGFGIPLYFLMSVNRGLYQGNNRMKIAKENYKAACSLSMDRIVAMYLEKFNQIEMSKMRNILVANV
jgi:hypothetical protein